VGEAALSVRRALAAVALALLPLATPAAVRAQEIAAAVAAGDDIVRSVELRSDAAVDRLPEALELITIRAGERYDEQQARRTVRNLRASGLAAEAEVWTAPAAGGGLEVTVAIWTTIQVEKVELLGSDFGLDKEALRRDVEVREGDPLVEDRVLRTVYRLQDHYHADGYFDATVRSRVTVDESRKRARVAFALTAGQRWRIGAISFDGPHGPFTDAQLVAELKARPDSLYRQSTVRDDGERLRRWLHEQGYRQAEVELQAERHEPSERAVSLDYKLDVHGRIELEVVGATVKELRKHDLLPFLGDEGYDDVVVLQAIDRIKRWYQERGHYHVAVEHQEEKSGEDIHLRLVIEPGPAYTLRDVRFLGNEGVDAEKLAGLMTTAQRRLLVAGSGRLVDEVLAEDLENVRAYYALSGWGQAKVGPAEVGESGHSLVLSVPIVEGPRSRVVNLDIEGIHALDAGKLRRELPLQAAGPFHPRLLEETLDDLRGQYEQAGYPYAQISASTSWNPDHTLVDVTVRVLEGPQETAAHLIVRGNHKTDTDVIRTIAGVTPGEPLSRRRLLEVQRSLYQLGIFSRVDVSLPPAGDSVRERDVLVDVEESSNRRVAYGLGYDSEEGPIGLLGYSHANLFGRAMSFQGDLRATKVARRFHLLLRQPYWGGSAPGSIAYLVYQEAERRTTYSVDQRGAQTQLSRSYGRWNFSLVGDYRQVELSPGSETLDLSDLPLDQQRAFQDVNILSAGPHVVWDARDDPVDPHRGSELIGRLKYAFPAGQIADQHFLEVFSQFVHLFDLGKAGVVAVSARGGAIEQLATDKPVAVSELFFAGGRTSHRAYGRDELGIPGETLDPNGVPLGGKGLALGNVDYRFPITGGLGGTLFVDAGNVWADWRDIRWQDVKPGVGIGVRYLTPVGPLRVDVGWKLDKEPGESKSALLFSLGNAF